MDFIKAFWEKQGSTHRGSHTASWGDRLAIELEIETISRHIKPGDRVLDIGCANGFSTFRQYELNPAARYTGVDYAVSMIEHANEALAEKKLSADKIRFSVASILDLPFPDSAFEVAYTTRVLINLSTWEQQQRGIVQALRVVRKGGLLVVSEGFWEPLCLLNSLRLLVGLPPLAEHDFNRYLKKAKLEAWLNEQRLSFEVEDFSSVYYLGSRVLRELIQKEELPFGDYSSPVNKLFYDIEREYSGGGMGVQQAYVIRK
jgi:ubiquinone/menaquinone biosynthesis C-methylase UbiE